MIYRRVARGSRYTLVGKPMIYLSGPGERSREEAGMCTRRSRRALWRSQSGCCSLGPRRVRPPVRSSRRLLRARRGERENKNGRERIGGLFYWRRSRGREGKGEGSFLFYNRQKGINFSWRETWFASLVSRDAEPIVSVFCGKEKGTERRIKAPVHFREPEVGGPGPRLVEESMFTEFTQQGVSISCVFLEMEWRELRRKGSRYIYIKLWLSPLKRWTVTFCPTFSIKYLYRLSFFADRGSFVLSDTEREHGCDFCRF